jgi:hypothetical protein
MLIPFLIFLLETLYLITHPCFYEDVSPCTHTPNPTSLPRHSPEASNLHRTKVPSHHWCPRPSSATYAAGARHTFLVTEKTFIFDWDLVICQEENDDIGVLRWWWEWSEVSCGYLLYTKNPHSVQCLTNLMTCVLYFIKVDGRKCM